LIFLSARCSGKEEEEEEEEKEFILLQFDISLFFEDLYHYKTIKSLCISAMMVSLVTGNTEP
jgi:hypothetical protein